MIDPYIEAQRLIDAKNDAKEMAVINSIGIDAYNIDIAKSNVHLDYVVIPLVRYTKNGAVIVKIK